MSTIELILVPLYLFLLYRVFRARGHNLDPEIRVYYIKGFWIKMFASILFVLYYTYLTGGDSTSLFYPEGYNFYQLLLKDSANWKYMFMRGDQFDESLIKHVYSIGYFRSESNFMIIRLTAVLCFFSFGYYSVISLFFAAFAYAGLWKLFLFFYKERPEMKKAFAISILFFPSVIFWSSGLIKDSVTMGCIGFLTFSLTSVANGRRIVRNLIVSGVSIFLIAIIKIYILLAYLPFLLLYLVIIKLRAVKSSFFRVIISGTIVIGSFFTFSQTYSSFEDQLGNFAVENLAETMTSISGVLESRGAEHGAESNYDLGAEFDGTFNGFLKVAPYALVATFYRPFIWETRKVSQLMAAIESLVLIFLTLKIILKAGPFRIVKHIFSDPMILFCFLFATTFAMFVGTTTPNFGSLVRYKIPCLPFYAITLFLIFGKEKVRRQNLSLNAGP